MFAIDHEYDRTSLLEFVGSKQYQSGIIWGDKNTNCVIITSGGRHGKRVGYGDSQNKDGSWSYIGQGSEGDQNPNSKANSMLVKGDRDVLLFSTREPNAQEVRSRGNHKKLYRFEGIFRVASWDFEMPTTGKRRGEKLLSFLLMPANNIFDLQTGESLQLAPKIEAANRGVDISNLRDRIASMGNVVEKGKLSPKEYRKRSKLTRDYAILRANGVCENCEHKAPFLTVAGVPFLEVHHIFNLSDDGPDMPENVAAICPNCHREAHFGILKKELNEKLHAKILLKEQFASAGVTQLNALGPLG